MYALVHVNINQDIHWLHELKNVKNVKIMVIFWSN